MGAAGECEAAGVRQTHCLNSRKRRVCHKDVAISIGETWENMTMNHQISLERAIRG